MTKRELKFAFTDEHKPDLCIVCSDYIGEHDEGVRVERPDGEDEFICLPCFNQLRELITK